MHHPPEVRFLVGGSLWPRRLLVAVGMLAVLQVIGFALLNPMLTWHSAAVGGSLLVAMGLAWFWTDRPASGDLYWDGTQWQWSGFTHGACTLQLHLDFQALVLVSLKRPGSAPVWLWLQRSQDSYAWQALRRAMVYTASSGRVHRAPGPAPSQPIGTP